MERITYTMSANDFFIDDIYGNGKLETIIDIAKKGLLEKMYFEKIKGKDGMDFIISFSKKYWSDYRINEEIEEHLRVVNGLYKNPIPSQQSFIDRAEAYKMIADKKPFDIILELKTKEYLFLERHNDKNGK